MVRQFNPFMASEIDSLYYSNPAKIEDEIRKADDKQAIIVMKERAAKEK